MYPSSYFEEHRMTEIFEESYVELYRISSMAMLSYYLLSYLA